MSEKIIKTQAKTYEDSLRSETNNSRVLQGAFATKAYRVISPRLQTTIAELDILSGTQALARPSFDQNDDLKTITIPTIFAKVNGVPKSESIYWQKMNKIEASEGLQALVTMHLSDEDWQLHTTEGLQLLDNLTTENLMESDSWAYGILNRQLQIKIANAIVQCFLEWPFTFKNTPENALSVLRMTLDMPKDLLEMSMEVDYPQEVPLLAFLHKDDFGELTKDDIIGLTVFHYLGWDVIVYAPNGYASIENIISSDNFDEFYYDKMKSTTSAQSNKVSFFKRLLNRFLAFFK